MSSYNTFAQFYDSLTENVEYSERTDYILSLYNSAGGKVGNVLDLACGTGSVALNLTEKGFNVIGLDLSAEMLSVADSKAQGDVKFVCGDMTDFSFNKRFNLCVCCLDSINHLTDLSAVQKCFDCVYNSLENDGIFIFDVNTVYKHNEVLADNTFVFDEEDFFLSWDNELEDDGVVRILLDFFVFNGENYDRYSEEFYEKAYTVDELKSALSKYEILGIYDEMSENRPKPDSERLYFVCKRKNLNE
ncbi:MAG: class I SAM-dependent methyltransferase [Eubacteriales bacterium]|nr:class I SAM-dependent methyltransferase [Eubacteriales bacterium]